MGTLLYGLGRSAVRRRRLVVLAWVLVAIGIFGVAQARGGETSERFEVPGVEAQRALDMLEERFPSEAGTSAQRLRR
jgi:putative drug exporter of the RND superfamily